MSEESERMQGMRGNAGAEHCVQCDVFMMKVGGNEWKTTGNAGVKNQIHPRILVIRGW